MEEVKKQGMESLFCPYEQAIALKELGFDEPCILCYHTKANDNYNIKEGWLDIREFRNGANFNNSEKFKEFICSAPLYQQAFRWFREKYQTYPVFSSPIEGIVKFHIPNIGGDSFSTYEEAELECLKKLIELCKRV